MIIARIIEIGGSVSGRDTADFGIVRDVNDFPGGTFPNAVAGIKVGHCAGL